jgi:hypothetical protein
MYQRKQYLFLETSMKKLAKRILTVGALGLLWAGSSNAAIVEGVTDPVNHTAEILWSVVAGNLVVTVENTGNDGTITSFGFTVTDEVTGVSTLVSVSGTGDNEGWTLITCTKNGVDGEDCVTTGKNEFGGTVAAGIAVGGTGTFTFDGVFADPSNLDDFFVRWQATGPLGEGSDKGVECTTEPCDPPDFPEPGTLALLGMGLLGLGASRRRRKLLV